MKTSQSAFNIERIRADFPILNREVKPGVPLIYLDSAASSQKPQQVIESMDHYYRHTHANIHRGVHTLAEEATAAYEESREKVARFINAPHARQVIFTRNATESINLVAYAWGRTNIKAGDMIILTEMEHHANLVPWQVLAQEKNARLEFIPITSQGLLDLEEYRRLLQQSPKIVAFMHASNVLGTINPAAEMIHSAHEAGALVMLDAAQSAPHISLDVQALDADFVAFSAHKMCGPTGIGALYGRESLLEAMPPFLTGGDMIKRVYLKHSTYNELPYKFEAGTPAIAEGIGFGAAVDYLSQIGMQNIHTHEQALVAYAMERLEEVNGIHIVGPSAEQRGGLTAFTMDGIHPHDVAQILDTYGVAVRAGHHCAMPLHDKLGVTATTRASFYLYNTFAEIDRLIEALYKVKAVFG